LIDSIINQEKSDDKKNKKWVAFGNWLGMKKPIKRKQVQNHLKNKWKKL